MGTSILPYGNISSPKKLGQAVRAKRKDSGLTQVKAAALCGVGVRFISDLENGKSTSELGKTLSVLSSLGLVIDVRPRGLLSQNKAKQDKSKILNKTDQNYIFESYKNTISKLANSYKGSLNLSSTAFNDLSKHRIDFYSLGVSMDKYNDMVKNYKHILDLNSTAVSGLSNVQASIDKLGMKRGTFDSALDSIKSSVSISSDALNSIKKLQSTIGSLNLDTKLIDTLQSNYKTNIKISNNALHKLTKFDNKIFSSDIAKKK